MRLDLRELLELGNKPDVESETAAFYMHVPHVAPLAYHHILFKPASEESLEGVSATLDIPHL